MTDDQKAALITIGLAAFETIYKDEQEINPKGPRFREIRKVLDQTVKATDLYRHVEWPPEKISKAAAILDAANEMLHRDFGNGVYVTDADWMMGHRHQGEGV